MMSAVYYPQNLHCIAIDNKTTDDFKKALHSLEECFPNITVIVCFKVIIRNWAADVRSYSVKYLLFF